MRMFRLLGIAALAAAPALAGAQSAPARSFGLGVSGGASVPIGDLGDFVSTGYSVAGHVFVMPASLNRLSFRGDVAFDRWGFKDVGSISVDGSTRSLSVTANALVKMSSTGGVQPYLIGGGGMYMSKAKVGNLSSDSESDPGVQGGLGINFALSGFSTFLEAKIVNVFSGDDSEGSGSSSARWIPITFGIRF